MQSIVLAIPALTFLLLQITWARVSCNALVGVCGPYPWFLFIIVVLVFALKNKVNHFSVLGLLAVLLLQAQVGILQFAVQSDVNLHQLGEPVLSVDTPGIAKFLAGNIKVIRAYGFTSHANVFGGVMLAGLFLVTFLPKGIARSAMYSTLLLALVLSFSRTALTGYFLLAIFHSIRLRAHVMKTTAIPILVILAVLSPLLWMRATDNESVSLTERWQGYAWSVSLMKNNTIWSGTGLGTYSETLKHHLNTNDIHYEYWEIAPVHSVPLLLSAELGVAVSLLLAVVILGFILRSQYWYMLIFTPALLFDHYFVTVPSALFLLFMLYTFWNGGGLPQITDRGTARTAR